ncbi:MAG TPA: DUF1524 domain-containing protein [Azospirillaceae bacterium]|nr:DUF1524 domain-containing protein [Azospirillaceae bacterium]
MARPTRRFGPTILILLVATILAAVLLDGAGLLPSGIRPVVRLVEREVLGLDTPEPDSPPPDRAIERLELPPDRLDYAAIRRQLDAITVEPEHRRGYNRDEWPHWREVKGCINTRDQVLIDQSLTPVTLSPNGCAVTGGQWHDPYTGKKVRDPKSLDIDHMVPLEEAHGSGGWEWPRDRRAAFANDRTNPHHLIAVLAEANRAKGAKGPEEWLPPHGRYRCRYIADWITIKARWKLSMDERERVTVGNILSDCTGSVSHWNKVAD